MLLKVVKNTVLFSIIIGIFFITNSCGDKTKIKTSATTHKDHNTETASNGISTTGKGEALSIKPNKNTDTSIVIAANKTKKYIPLLKNKRVAIVANQTSVIFKENAYTHIVDSLLQLQINVKKVFAPEHGFRGTADAGELVKDGIDTKTGLPIYSLHGKHKKPTAAQLNDVDLMIFDIQDVGVRFYTYISTLHYVMEACAEQNIPLIVLDRPNPNGNYIDGPVLETVHSNFLGMHPIPLIHGMTIGEYAKMINGEAWLKNKVVCQLTIIELDNYNHEAFYNVPIRPSPNLPNSQSITLYPSLGLFEGTNINAGRGTEFQFQRYGAPFLDKSHYKFSYTPVANFGSKYPKHKNELCYGTDLSKEIVERHFTLKYIMDAYKHSTDKSKFFNTSNFTAHAGTKKLQQQIEAGLSESEIKATWQDDIAAFKIIRQKYLIYK
ncbi:exo-beta-N-acetylmuramidase NamZ family protein [Winogradskyella endarachnes]|uniref:DUF1343 domain-containing protein n=1 Tax=Winogradskyella endarachnes TaxID=2681965 RepID=A0A6L6UBA0_9FLAO|nr:DUF1343 domain-containing protein [Winogradskyella endarachnes]MUU79635.1 DUF1343 domain-containing protein [Winogradskyella endarachnes]